MPGPELRVTEGDTVRISVQNDLAEPTTVHWHGVDVPANMDGVPGLSQEPIAPGGVFTYEFVATPAGTRWYHAHVDNVAQQANGLVGALIIEPKDAPATKPDREYTLLTQEWITDVGSMPVGPMPGQSTTTGMPSGMMGQGPGGMMGSGATDRPVFDTLTVNGKAYGASAPLMLRQGERVHLRLINANAMDTQVFALAGHRLTVTHSDGNPIAHPTEVDAVPLGAGERADVEFTADNPGRWHLLGLLENQARPGPLTDVVYEGHEGDSAQDFAANAQIQIARYSAFGGPSHPNPPDRTYELTLSGGMMMGMGSETSWTINGKSYPNTDPLDVRPGERVRIKLLNMSMEDHPMHLHGHTFQVVGIGGQPVDGPLKDTLTIRPMEAYAIEFVANNPGRWLFHCHNLMHMGGGLMTEVRYR